MSATAPAPESPPRRLIRLSKAIERLGVCRATCYRWMETDPTFPRPVRRQGAPNSPLLFFSDEIDAYLDALAAKR